MHHSLFRPGLAIAITAFLSCLSACSDSVHTGLNTEGQPVIFVPAPPYAYLVEKLAGDEIEVRTLVGENDDPHSYSPTPKEVADLAGAMIYFTADLPFETALIETLENSSTGLKIIDMVDQLQRREFSHGEDHGHHHGKEYDPHVWLSPALFAKQAALVANELIANIDDTALATRISANSEKLIAEIKALDAELAKKLAPMKARSFYTYHGAFGYLADAYGLKQQAIEFAGRSPEPKQIVELIKKARADGVKMILVQPQFDQAGAISLAEAINGVVVPINPMAKDVLESWRKLAELVSTQ